MEAIDLLLKGNGGGAERFGAGGGGSHLDQIVVAPAHWRSGVGAALLGEARRMSPGGLDLDVNTDNARAISFYRKEGFAIIGEGKNPISGKPVYRMSWRP